MNKSTEKNSSCCLGLLGGIAVLLLFLFAYGMSSIDRHRNPDLAKISQYLHIGFPKGTELIGSDMNPEFRQDNTILARLRLSRSRMRGFIKSLPKPVSTSASDRLGVSNNQPLSDPPAWWRPNEVSPFYAIEVNLAPKSGREIDVLKVLFDTSKKNTVDLYLYWESS